LYNAKQVRQQVREMRPKMAILITQDRQVANLTPPEGKSRITVSVKSKVGSGLSVESRSGSQTKSWIYRPYLNGKQIKITLGSYPAMTLSQAREAHADALALVKQGIDPRYARKTEKQQNEQMPIFSQL
ncbi:Arm DNA-binding domain-containing protein, partial [Escherichia coli]